MTPTDAVEAALREAVYRVMTPENSDTRRFEARLDAETRITFSALFDPIRFMGVTKDGDLAVEERIKFRVGSFDIIPDESVPKGNLIIVQPATEASPERRITVVNIGEPDAHVDPE